MGGGGQVRSGHRVPSASWVSHAAVTHGPEDAAVAQSAEIAAHLSLGFAASPQGDAAGGGRWAPPAAKLVLRSKFARASEKNATLRRDRAVQ